MSSKKGTTAAAPSGSANPAVPVPLTPAQLQEWSWTLKQISDNKWIVRAVLVAGLAGFLEILHLFFLAIRFVYHWIQGSWHF